MNLFAETLAWLMNPERWSGPLGIPVAIAQHLGYTFLAVLVAAVIAIPVGWAIGHTGKGREIAVAISGAARAIPSFGLLVLLVLLMGVLQTQAAAIITFVLLGIPSILAGAYAGFEAIDRRVIDAGRAMGMTEWQILWRIEVPLGLPLLVSGLRAATLQIVATVTIAAYVGLGGLGLYIIQGINLNRFDQVLAGAILVAALALVLDALFAIAERLVVPRGVLAGRGGGAGPGREKRRDRAAPRPSVQASPA
ncbi:ABC-type glycine betaine transport, permease protein [Microbacterium sp. C448]|uniref:ABC transporter permease n=1 Tax=Microbacterium sp. C448 TaxID=1177594 RepID=UPI0003DE0FA5|nr:ABC transporter permease [Microbacterium sp. C448]CDK01053.1 ABC-type glycine betaine transport, permease protein [Microbacterium sp. C448]|tara:strand:+ start:4698 stop:5450 length:753 start_codon:yes stop_codon:yes gene_type:complete